MPDVTPRWMPGDTITAHCEVAVTGRRFVSISGPTVDGNPQVSPTGAGLAALGVAARDKLTGEKVMVIGAPGTIVPVDAGAAITAGQKVQSDASGRAIPLAAGVDLGLAVDDGANGATALVKLFA